MSLRHLLHISMGWASVGRHFICIEPAVIAWLLPGVHLRSFVAPWQSLTRPGTFSGRKRALEPIFVRRLIPPVRCRVIARHKSDLFL